MKYLPPIGVFLFFVVIGAVYLVTTNQQQPIDQIAENTHYQMACVARYEQLKSVDSLTAEESEQFVKLRKEIDEFIKEYPDSLREKWENEIR